jgi:phosphohistidine phosphatase
MKTLLILRHAKSSWDDPKLADQDRPLNKRGKREAPRIGKLLREEDLLPDLILSSTARRARKTAEAVAEASGYSGEIEFSGAFYPGDPSDYIDTLQDAPDGCECIMVVGHNPGLEELLETLTGESAHLTTAALAQVSLPILHWYELDGETEGKLLNLWRAKQLG